MSEQVYVRPAQAGLLVPAPAGGTLPAEGAWVPLTSHWRRAISRGDVVVGAPSEATGPAVEVQLEEPPRAMRRGRRDQE